MEIIVNQQKNRAIKSYIRQLPVMLVKDYGVAKHYTAKQVVSSAQRASLNLDNIAYAIAIFASRESFDQYHAETDATCDYDALRKEVAEKFFKGNKDLGIAAMLSLSSGLGGGGFEGSCGADAGDGD